MIVRIIKRGQTEFVSAPPVRMGLTLPPPTVWAFGLCATALLAVTILNPTFVPKIVFTAYADAGTAVAVAFGGVLGWRALGALGANEAGRARRLGWQFGMVMVALINLKQANLVLFAALLSGFALVAARDSTVAFGAFLRLLVPMVLPAIALFLIWRLHVMVHLSSGEFTIRPVSEWSFGLAPDIIARMALIASKKGGYFGLMAIAIGFAGRALWYMRSDLDRLATIVAVTFVLYNGFLFVAYLSAFTPSEASRAASYWRYKMHVGGLGVAFAAYGLTNIWRRVVCPHFRLRLDWLAVALIVALPIALSGKLRFDDRAPKRFVRSVGAELAGILPKDARLVVLDPLDNGFYRMVLRYELHRSAGIVGAVTAFNPSAAREIGKMLATTDAGFVWVHVTTEAIDDALGVALPRRAAHLLQRSATGWSITRSWSYPGYRLPTDGAD